jgi:CRP/FNR family transcriptional regulator, cyclic AMP receptor protein
MIGQIVGAHRPTVTAAVRQLIDAGDLDRRPDGSWLLTGEEHTALADDDPGPLVPPRRRMLVARAAPTGVQARAWRTAGRAVACAA